MTNKITITKKIAKQGRNHIIVVPAALRHMLRAGDLVQLEITHLPQAEDNDSEIEVEAEVID